MLKDIEYFIKNKIFTEKYLLKKRLKRSILNNYEVELNLLDQFKDKNKDAIDIGVYRGVYSYKLSKLFNHIYSFEPNPLIYPYLKKNLSKIINNITLFNYALSNEDGARCSDGRYLRSGPFFGANFSENGRYRGVD